MNKELMLKVADAIEDENVAGKAVGLDMSSWFNQSSSSHPCGTTACIAGFATIIQSSHTFKSVQNFEVASWSQCGQRALGLSDQDAAMLFHAGGLDPSRVTNSEGDARLSAHRYVTSQKDLVPDALRWMAVNETIDWERGLRAAQCLRDGPPPPPPSLWQRIKRKFYD